MFQEFRKVKVMVLINKMGSSVLNYSQNMSNITLRQKWLVFVHRKDELTEEE